VPTPVITSGPAPLSNSTSATFTVTTAKGTSLQCSLDAAAFSACSSPQNYNNLGQGQHTFTVRAVQGADLSANASRVWTIDSIAPPAPAITQKPSDPTYTASNTFAWPDGEPTSTYQCSEENGAWLTCSSPFTWDIVTTNYGQHQFGVRAIDQAGNASAGTYYSFKYEKGLPASRMPFAIAGSVGPLPIGVWKSIPVTITNPNSVTIYVNALTVAVAADSTPAGCLSSANIELQQSNISTTATVAVMAGQTVTLPVQAAAAPQIRLTDLPAVNQDVCKGKAFALSYSGTATN
jgi:hypothetical protein